jgi:hypothetical protein
MAFVKVVGGIEIYNFRIQSFLHFYTNFWSIQFQHCGPAACSGPDAARRRVRVPVGLSVRATRRPRPHAARAAPSPDACAPRRLFFFLRHTSPPSVPCARAEQNVGPSTVPHADRGRRRTTAASSPSSGRHRRACAVFKAVHSPRACAKPPPLLPLHRARHCRPPVNLPLHGSTVLSNRHELLPRFLPACVATRCWQCASPAVAAARRDRYAGRRRAPSPESSPLEPRSPPRPR